MAITYAIPAGPRNGPEHSYKFRKKEILRGRRNFEDLFRRGKVFTTRDLRVVHRENGLGHARIAVSVGKRLGKSHDRNYMRRVIKEIVRTNKGWIRPGHDLSVVVRQRAFSGLSFEEKTRAVRTCLERV